MKNLCISAVFAAMAVWSFAQNSPATQQVSIQSNGVIVHVSAGNEGFGQPVNTQSSETRTIEDWTLPECIDALRVIDEKMRATIDEDRHVQPAYAEQRALIEQRIQFLTVSAQ